MPDDCQETRNELFQPLRRVRGQLRGDMFAFFSRLHNLELVFLQLPHD